MEVKYPLPSKVPNTSSIEGKGHVDLRVCLINWRWSMTSTVFRSFWEQTEQVHCMGYDMVLTTFFPKKYTVFFCSSPFQCNGIRRLGTFTGFDPGSASIRCVVISHLPKSHSVSENISENSFTKNPNLS